MENKKEEQMKQQMKEDLKISIPHVENPDNQQTSNMLRDILEEAKAEGILDFKAVRYRKCDFCEKRLEEGDDFITEELGNGDILDKCAECVKDGK